jgi:hypothetical protein
MTPDDVLIERYWEGTDKSKLEQATIWRIEAVIRWTFRQSILYSKNHSLLSIKPKTSTKVIRNDI